ncbi:hypothetical protein BXZ70DRAFT_1008842 [Cristinia sonorae]|uniref:BTB domain-containing protein n=1 Tax=Cristinia sonorae TaxID=1940300 RepID=A0A8K0UMB1_9AGAR|nr:hypothetical protein BXZ70DRAFT_1008842 [Cristinia sonorae]
MDGVDFGYGLPSEIVAVTPPRLLVGQLQPRNITCRAWNWFQHPVLWFNDGNLILAVRGTLFRIYRGILCDTSSVFQDMFALPQPRDNVEMMYGCPVVYLDDPVEDMVNFLKVLYRGISIAEEIWSPQYWPVTRAMIRLGDKYDAEAVLARGEARLMARLPHKIEDWNALYEHFGRPSFQTGKYVEDVIGMVNIGRLRRNKGVIARALYLCAQLKTRLLLDGCRGADGSREYLHNDDLACCIDARPGLRARNHWLKTTCVFPQRQSSFQCDRCCDKYDAVEHRESMHTLEAGPKTSDPLAHAGFIRIQCEEYDFCADCTREFMKKDRKLRQDFLDDLWNDMFPDGDPREEQIVEEMDESEEETDEDEG